MTPNCRVLPAVEQDVDGQAAFLSREASLETALRFYDAVASTFAELAQMPHLGEQRASPDVRFANIRVWRVNGFPNHLIFYRPTGDGIEVVRVLHSARDVNTILAK